MRRLLWICFLVPYVMVALLFLAGYAAYYIHPDRLWWIELIAVALPYLSAFLLVLGTPVLLLAKRPRLLVFHGVLLLLIAFRFVSLAPLLRSTEARPDDLRLMTFNVPRWWGYLMDQKKVEMLELVQAEAPHLISLQETSVSFSPAASGVKAVPYLAVLLDSLDYQIVGPQSGGMIYSYLPVLGRIDLLEQTRTVLRLDGTGVGTRVVRTRFRWQEREAVLYNVHLRTFGEQKPWQDEGLHPLNPGFWVPYLKQYREAYRIRAWEVEQIRAMLARETLPVIVCGDFNSTPHNWVYRRLAEGMQDAFALSGRGWGMTYHTRFPFARIDYVLLSAEWEPVKARVANAWLSDHLPLVVTVRWRETEGN